jgi:hypothetical protein
MRTYKTEACLMEQHANRDGTLKASVIAIKEVIDQTKKCHRVSIIDNTIKYPFVELLTLYYDMHMRMLFIACQDTALCKFILGFCRIISVKNGSEISPLVGKLIFFVN